MLLPFLGATLLVRVLTDDGSSSDSRHSGSLNLSGVIAVAFVLVAAGLLLHRRRGVTPTILAALWLGVWTVVALSIHGASTETMREGVREASVVALAAIVYNAREIVTAPVAARLVQIAGVAPALLALYQLVTNTGTVVAGHVRSNGTFAHPNSAAVFFAIAAVASLWLYLDGGQRRFDAFLAVLFAAAQITTVSIDGLLGLIAMLMTFGALHGGSRRVRLVPFLAAGLVALVFFGTPLGSERIAKESSTSLSGEPNTSLAWRFRKWKLLLPEWERSPVLGRGLGATTTIEAPTEPELTIAAFRRAYLRDALPHNEYLRYLVETGVVGLVLLLGALAILLGKLFRRRRVELLDASAANAPTLAIAVIAGCLVNSLADNTFLNSPTCYAAVLVVIAVLGIRTRRATQLT
ncbi:MAG: O-antigen ligase family protein [Solirubrobacteraceae bacterium]